MDSDSSEDDGFDPQEMAAVEEMMAAQRTQSQGSAKSYTNNKVGLLAKLDEIRLPEKMPWIERLDFLTPNEVEVENAQDDLKRESEFYVASLKAASAAIIQLEQARIPFLRPPDYFAEMMKPDSQMQRIKDSLLKEKKMMDVSAARQKHKEDRKYQREVHSERMQERALQKRAHMEGLRKQQDKALKGGEKSEERSMVGTINEALQTERQKHAEKNEQRGERKRSKKRAAADKKYGFGGQRKRQRMNDSKSSGDMRSYKPGQNKKHGIVAKGGKAGKGGKGGKGGKRPGKAARIAARK